MLKLDRTIFSTSKIADFKKESDNYIKYSENERFLAFAYLQSVAYNFPINQYPKMDKTYFKTRKLNG